MIKKILWYLKILKEMKIRVIKFWCIAFYHLIKHTLKGQNWHMIHVDFDCGVDDNGDQIRKRLIAKKSIGSLDIFWKDVGF